MGAHLHHRNLQRAQASAPDLDLKCPPWVTFFLFDDPGFRYNQYVRTQTNIGDETEDEEFELAAAGFEERGFGIRVRRAKLDENPIAITVTFNDQANPDAGTHSDGGMNPDISEHSRVELRVLEALRYALVRPSPGPCARSLSTPATN